MLYYKNTNLRNKLMKSSPSPSTYIYIYIHPKATAKPGLRDTGDPNKTGG